MIPKVITGDLLNQNVEVIINSWNRNIIPWWLLIPQGVSRSIKKCGGTKIFQELRKFGPIPLGEARLTSSGYLPFKGIIHVAGINMLWVATKYSVEQSVINAMEIVNQHSFKSVAFPLIGSGSGNRKRSWSLNIIQEALMNIETSAEIIIVKYEN